TAYGGRRAKLAMTITPVWTEPGEDAGHIAWTRQLYEAMLPFAHGVYVNFLGTDDGEARVRSAYGTALYDRLAKVKSKYDPANLFRVNHNIKPARENGHDIVS